MYEPSIQICNLGKCMNPIWVSKKKATENLWFAERQNQAKISLSTVYKVKRFFFFTQKSFLKKRRSGVLNKKWNEGFLTVLTTAIKKDPSTSIREAHLWIESQQENCEDIN